ncbi:hypothetical protein BQ8482_280115 [Mesorhizobium delmotii]|uniref:Uncharacterized protein n=1 Tax=Mesorhizobium delmotii TaxID=1631247 RepID=A0A2P9AMP4_9HYPH|nr:hypothetical protein BQ8482_280115 [Mesorhizobium delmotii]
MLWLLWVGEVRGLLWIGIYALLLPKIVAEDVAQRKLSPANAERSRSPARF